MSGLEVEDSCVEIFEGGMNMRSSHKFATFKIQKKCIVPDVIGSPRTTNTKEQDKAAFDELQLGLGEEPRYILFDFEFSDEQDGRKYKKLAFIFWCPDSCKVGIKMIYTANKDFVLRLIPGVSIELQAHDPAEFNYEAYCREVQHKASGMQAI